MRDREARESPPRSVKHRLLGAVLPGLIARWPRPSFAVASLLDRVRMARKGQDIRLFRDMVMWAASLAPSQPWPYPRVASEPDPSALRPPLIVVTFHVGPFQTLGAFLERLPGPVVAMRNYDMPSSGKVEWIAVGGSEFKGVVASRRAVTVLRSGGFAFLGIDGPGTTRVTAPIFGRAVPLAGGAFSLARRAGAAVLPVAVRWRGRKIEIVSGEPVPPGDDSAMGAAIGEWIERYLTETPGALEWPITRTFLSHPPLAESTARTGP